KDKFPWAPVPTASWSANNRSIGLLFVHGNLFGRGKQLLLGGRWAQVDSGAALAYRDPALLGSWAYWQVQGFVQQQTIPEYDRNDLVPLGPVRETHFASYGFEATLGVAWLRRVRTQIAWQLQQIGDVTSDIPSTSDTSMTMQTLPAARGAVVGMGKANLSFDFR